MGVVANLIVRVGADIEGFEKKLASLEKTANRHATKLTSLGSKLTTGFTLPIIGIGAAAFKMSTDFNKSMANVASLIPENVARVNELKRGVQDLSIATGKSTTDMSAGLYTVISAFGDTADTLDILRINARAATAGLSTTEEAIALTSAVTKGYGDTSAAAVAKAADLAQMTVRLGQTTFPELAASVGRVTPLTAGLAVKQEELFAVMATGTGVTGKAAEVSTQLRGIMQSLMAPTDAASKLFGEMGVSSGKALIEQRGLHGAIAAFVDEAKRSGQPLQKFISSIQGQTLALALAGSQSTTYKDKLGEMTKAQGEVDRAFKKQTEGVNAAGFMWEQLKARVTVYLQRAGDQLAPHFLTIGRAIVPLLERGMQLLQWFSALPKPVQTTAFVVVGLVAALGPLLWITGTLIGSFGALSGAAVWVSKTLGLKTIAARAATVANTGLAASARGAGVAMMGMAKAAAFPSLIIGSVVALGAATYQTAKGVRNLWAAWKEGTFLQTLLAKEDDNWARRALGLTDPNGPKGRQGKDISLSNESAAADELAKTLAAAKAEAEKLLNAGGTGGSGKKSPLQERLEGIRDSAKGLILDARAWAARITELGGVTKAPESATRAFHGALQGVIDSYGSLKLAGLGALDALFQRTDAMVGKVADYKRAFASLISLDPMAALAGAPGGLTLLQDTFKAPSAPTLDLRTSARANLPIARDPLDVLAAIHQFPGVELGKPAAVGFLQPFRDAFKQFGNDIPNIIADAFKNGRGMAAIGGAIATGLAATFAGNFNSKIGELMKQGKEYTQQYLQNNPGMAALGGIGVGAGAFLGGYSMGATSGKAKGALGGAASGAMAGAAFGSVVPGIGTAIGAVGGGIIGAIGGFFGGRSKDKKDQQALADSRKELLAHFGGLDALKKKAEEVGFSVSTMLSTKNAAAFTAEVEKLNAAIAEKQKRWEGVAMAIDGVNARAMALVGPLQTQSALVKELKANGQSLFDSGSGSEIEANAEKLTAATKRMKEMATAAQPEFERLGQFATAAFAGMIREGATAMEAFAALSPTLDVLAAGVTDFGMQGTEAITRLLGMRELVKVHEAEFAALAANQQMLKGFGDAGLMTRDLFVAFGADTAAQFQKIADKGGDVSKAMALSQPVLQQLWEGQQKYGAFTDEATSALLKQAEEQGLVGAHMKNVNEKILDVLLAIGDVFGAKLPDSMRTFKDAADSTFGDVVRTGKGAADDLQKQFNGIRVRVPLEVTGGKIRFSGTGEGDNYEVDVKGYREGTRGQYVDFGAGTLAMLHGRERIMTQAEGGGRQMTHAHVYLHDREIADAIVPLLPDAFDRAGVT